MTAGLRIGYKASAEQFPPRELVELGVAAEEAGMESAFVSDHFQPWRHEGGHAPFAIAWMTAVGERTGRITLGTSVLTPTFRYNPAVVAQAFATMGCLYPGRVILGVGSGEALNELATGGVTGDWPDFKERFARLRESVRLMRELRGGGRTTFEGEFYRTDDATVYDVPEGGVPVYVAAGGPTMAKYAGRAGDGFICTSGKDPALYTELLAKVAEGAEAAGKDPAQVRKMIEIKVCYDRDSQYAYDACRWWAALALPAEQTEGVEDPLEMERLADANADQAHTRFIVSADPQEIVDRIQTYVDLGFEDLLLHAPGTDQRRFLDQFGEDVMPLLRS